MLKLRKIRFDGFKAFDETMFHVVQDVLVLIGMNGAGKSSTLQAFALVREFGQGRIENFFTDRGWSRKDVRSKLPGKGSSFRADLLLEDLESGSKILWQFSLGLNSGVNVREAVWLWEKDAASPSRIMEFRDKILETYADVELTIRGVALQGSVLSLVDRRLTNKPSTLLLQLAEWAQGITSLELLSPIAMRRGARGEHSNIGSRGERLATFLASLDAPAKSRVVERLAQFYPISNVDTTRKRAGWVDLSIAESFKGFGSITAGQASDGFLRLLAICAIPEFSANASLILLDEIEDGIEPHILPGILRMVISETPRQFVLTTHSPVLVNFFEPEQVTVLGRDTVGKIRASKLVDLSTVDAGLEYFGGGELWTMMDRGTILKEVIASDSAEDDSEVPHGPRFGQAFVRDFMET